MNHPNPTRWTLGERVSRREILLGAAVAGAGVSLGGARPLGASQSPPCDPLESLTVVLPVFSLNERNRRWGAVRAIMARPQWNLDAIVTAPSDGLGDNARYLTQIVIQKYSQPAPEVLFPRDGTRPVYALINAERHVAEWTRRLQPGGWLSDGTLVLRPDNGSQVLAKLLAAEGLNRPGTRIGVAKLKGSRFDPEGLVSSTWLESLKAALPGVLFLPIDQYPATVGTDVGPIEEAAMVKGSEEGEVLRKVVAVNERAILAAVEAARRGARRQADLWWAAFRTMYAGTGEDVIRCSLSLDGPGNATLGEPTDHPVRPGQICNQEISAAYQGYGCQINHAFFIGDPATPGYDDYRSAIELLAKIHDRAVRFIQPGKTTYGDFRRHNEALFKELGVRGSGADTHGAGIGFLSRPRQSREDDLVVMLPGHAFDFKPSLVLDRAAPGSGRDRNRSVQLGEAYLVTETGVVRLGTRPLAPLATGTSRSP